jgi:lipopolysaccharide heptosyltransferase II
MKELDQVSTSTLDPLLKNTSFFDGTRAQPLKPGHPAALSQHQQPNFLASDLQRVLVVRLDNIGDLVMLSPALRALREAMPKAKITLMASPAGSQVASLLPGIDDVIVSRALWQDASGEIPFEPKREIVSIQALRERQFDAAMIFTSFSQSPFPAAYACYLAGIPHRIGSSKEFGGGVLSFSPASPPDNIHQVDRNLSLVQAANIHVHNKHLELHVPQDVQEKADQLLTKAGIKSGAPFIVLAPGASCAARRYDPERFATVVRMLSMESNYPVVIVGTSREAQTIEPVIRMAQENTHGRAHSLVGLTSVPELAAIIRRASLTIANNSGALHIADAFRCPMVILYSGTDLVSQWMPRNSPARLLCRPVFCAPCYNFDCPYSKECLDIHPVEVATAALEMLASQVYKQLPVHATERSV